MSPLQSLIVNDCEGMAACAMKNMQRLAYDSLRMSAGVGPKVTFQNTLPNLSISSFHTAHEKTEIWKAFT